MAFASKAGPSRRQDRHGGAELRRDRIARKERLARVMQKACGVGGTVKEGGIESQGDQRTAVAKLLTEAGFRQVFAGG